MDAESFIETANPPASSAGELMRDPLESRLRLFWRFTLVLLRLYAAAEEALFVFILSIVVFLYFVAASALPSGHFLKCLTSLLGVAPKFYCFFTTENTKAFFSLFRAFTGYNCLL
jgi:hypothetical protein